MAKATDNKIHRRNSSNIDKIPIVYRTKILHSATDWRAVLWLYFVDMGVYKLSNTLFLRRIK